MSPHLANIYIVPKSRPLPMIVHQMISTIIHSLRVLFMLSLRFIVSAQQVLFAQHSHEVLTTQGSLRKATYAFSPSTVNVALGNTFVQNVEKIVNKSLVATSL
jgi:hypothetical protein